MNKRGQFYIIISVVLAIAVFAITTTSNAVQEAVLFEDFEDLSNNYIHESEYVINSALENQQNVNDKLNNFTSNYLDYAKQRNPNLDLLFIYSDGTDILLVNHFDSTVNITDSVPITGSGEELDQDIFINVAGKEFSYKVPVRAENFGNAWYSGSVPNSFDLSVAGFLHTFDLQSGGGPEFKVIINLPEGEAQHTYDGSSGYEFQASPPTEEEKLLIRRQVKLRT